jgi:hypothetical protein
MIRSFRLSVAATFAVLALSALAPNANAQSGFFTVSGGSGSPLTLTLNAPITFTIATTSTDINTGFIVDGSNLANGFSEFSTATSSLTFSINGGGPITIDAIQGNIPVGAITADDAVLFRNGFFTSVAAGDTVTLFAGTLTSNDAFNAPPPTSGTYNVFIVRSSDGARISAVTAAPEPGSIGLALVGGIGLMGAVVRRRK